MAAKREPIPYKDTLAMPGSELYTILAEAATKSGKDRHDLTLKAEKSYQATARRHRDLLERYK